MKDDKISIFQMTAIYILVSIVPVVRYFPIIITDSAGKAAWAAAVLSIIPSVLLVWTLHILMNRVIAKNGKEIKNLSDVFNAVYGKIIESILPGRKAKKESKITKIQDVL